MRKDCHQHGREPDQPPILERAKHLHYTRPLHRCIHLALRIDEADFGDAALEAVFFEEKLFFQNLLVVAKSDRHAL